MNELEKSIRLTAMFMTEEEVVRLFALPLPEFNRLSLTLGEKILRGKVMTPNQWLELAFHLCKQRWDSSVEWLESQPMSKVNAMIQIQSEFGEKLKKANAKN